jgi:hypothetical protein
VVVGVGTELGDDAGSSLQDLVMCGTSAGIPGSVVPGDTAPAPGPQVSWVWGYLNFT